jgi:hypothetical protein
MCPVYRVPVQAAVMGCTGGCRYLCNKAAILKDTIKGTKLFSLQIFINWKLCPPATLMKKLYNHKRTGKFLLCRQQAGRHILKGMAASVL